MEKDFDEYLVLKFDSARIHTQHSPTSKLTHYVK